MKVNQLKAGVILSYGSMILSYVIAIVYTPIMLRLLGQSEYGLYNLVSSVVSYLGLLSFGFGSAYMRYYSYYKVKHELKDIAKLNGMFFVVFSILGLLAVAAGTVLVFKVQFIFGQKLSASELATAKILMAIMVFNIALTFPTTVFRSHIIANEEYVFQNMLQMIKTLVNPFVVLPVLLMGYKAIGLVAITTVLNLAVEISNVFFCFKRLKIQFLFRRFDFPLMKEMTVFSSYIFINMIIDQVNWNVSQFILGIFHGTVAVAVYGLAAQLNTYYVSLSTAISNVFIPKVNRMVAEKNDNQELTELLTRVGRLQFIVLSLICSGIIFFGSPFIQMWAGTEYSKSYYIVILLVVPVTVPLIQNVGIEIQKAKNMHQFRSVVYLLIAVGNVCLSIPLGQLYGGIGCAISTAISLLAGNGLAMNWYYHVKIGLDMKYYWRQIVQFMPSLLPPVAIGSLMLMYIDLYHVLPFLICGSIYVAVFCVSMWTMGLNQYEKQLVGPPLSRILKRLRLNYE